jgi:hypothetical protein
MAESPSHPRLIHGLAVEIFRARTEAAQGRCEEPAALAAEPCHPQKIQENRRLVLLPKPRLLTPVPANGWRAIGRVWASALCSYAHPSILCIPSSPLPHQPSAVCSLSTFHPRPVLYRRDRSRLFLRAVASRTLDRKTQRLERTLCDLGTLVPVSLVFFSLLHLPHLFPIQHLSHIFLVPPPHSAPPWFCDNVPYVAVALRRPSTSSATNVPVRPSYHHAALTSPCIRGADSAPDTRERPYSCTVCQKAFSRRSASSALSLHFRLLTGT